VDSAAETVGSKDAELHTVIEAETLEEVVAEAVIFPETDADEEKLALFVADGEAVMVALTLPEELKATDKLALPDTELKTLALPHAEGDEDGVGNPDAEEVPQVVTVAVPV
jgi:hypothetical protein